MATFIQPPAIPESPYRGIEPFRYIDRHIFSARESETWDLLSNILLYRGVLLYGDSGSGKSSLVNSGLIPAALKENLIPNRLRIQPRPGLEIKVERISIESGDEPPYLPSTFIEEGSEQDLALSIELSVRDFYKRLKQVKRVPAGQPRPLLIFDQFEEFITLFEEASHGGETDAAKLAQKEAPRIQRIILKALISLIEDETLPIKLLFVFREDYLAKFDLLFAACPELTDQYVRLLPPRVEEAEKIIRAPFVDKATGQRVVTEAPGDGGKEISPQLAAAITAQLRGRSGSSFINLSELQIICQKLWNSPDPVKYFEKREGDVQRVLEDYWSDVLEKLGDLYNPAIALLGQMVTSSNTRNIVSEPNLKSSESGNFTPEQIENALEALVQRKLVRREPRNKIYFYEIASEFLVPWIQQKNSERIAEIEARRLAAEAEIEARRIAAETEKQSEKARRKLKIVAVTLGSFLLLAALLAFYMYELQRKASKAEREAESLRALVEEQQRDSAKLYNLLVGLNDPNPQARLENIKELNSLANNQELPPEIAPVILAMIANYKDPAISKEAEKIIDLASQQANADLSRSIDKTLKENNEELLNKLPPRVYIQIANNDQRSRAERIGAELRRKGFIVPSYKDAGRGAPKRNELRYYESSSGLNPDEIIKTIKAVDRQDWVAVALPPSSKVRPGHFEIWLAPSPSSEQPPSTGSSIETVLPPEGTGYTTYNREPDGADQYGLESTISAIKELGKLWSLGHPNIRISIGDISRRGGGPFPPHANHRDGREFDIRPLTNNGNDESTHTSAPNYSSDLTGELISLIKKRFPGATISFNDPKLIQQGMARYVAGQHNHIHVRLP